MTQVSSPAVATLGLPRPSSGNEEATRLKWQRENMEQKEYTLTTIVDHAGSFNTSIPSVGSSPSLPSTPTSVSQNVTTASVASVASTASAATAVQAVMTYNLPPNILLQNGEYVEIEAYGQCAANTNSKTVDVLFGSTTPIATTGSLAANGKKWWMRARVTREATKVQNAFNFGGMANDAVIVPALAALTLDETLTQAISIQLTGAAASDVAVNSLVIRVGKLNTATSQS